jgi:hypothetical protein
VIQLELRTGSWLDPVRRALDESPAPVDLFFRNDDVGWDPAGLHALLDLFAEHSLPLDLAVIPCALDVGAADQLLVAAEDSPATIGFHQHGFAHRNHEPAGRKYEFGPSRGASLQRRDIAEGWRRLTELLGAAAEPIFTPPWNRCTPATGRYLVDMGFEVLSREASAPRLDIPGLSELPIRIDWFAHQKRVRLSRAEFGNLLAAAIGSTEPLGIMFHHAIMDLEERRDAGDLLGLLAGHDNVAVHSMRDLASGDQHQVARAL